jgi:poly-gamma-glutamate synthesis protein (capsule biosynthesis protein)
VQPYVATDSLITVYSLGNFISNQKKPNTDGGLLAEIEIEKGADGVCKYSLHVIPVWVKYPGHRLVSSEHDTDVKMTNDQRARYQYFLNNTKRLLEKGMNF